ncbi:extracellular solute-binding protein [bacterium]|jgi:ABC-type glycerol-3-phosphate transport system substrate-binding protein|nr:extracellular solute-binding protein [bacterium]MBT6832415.1 extracellular solute-binding protein [bacterium]MBT6996086.1 extracellular solute-binding protein [bacterium]MBT7772535.1 extracellular solute-binding protein [bacterium]
MKKFLAVVVLLILGFSFSACKKRDVGMAGMLPEGTVLKMQIWTAQEPDFIAALGREFLSVAQTPGLQVHVISFDSDAELQHELAEKMAEGRGPDVIFTAGDWIHQNSKKLVPLLQDETFSAQNFQNTFVHAAAESMIFENQIWGIPMAVDSLAVIFNEEHLIDRLQDRNSPAATWTDFKSDVEQLTKTDNSITRFLVSGAAIGRADNLNYGVEILENLMLQIGTTFFEPENAVARFATSAGVMSDGTRANLGEEALQFFVSFASPKYKNFSWNELIATSETSGRDFAPFLQGKVSMIFGKSRDLKFLKKLSGEQDRSGEKLISEKNIKVAFLPQFEDPAQTHTRDVVADVWAFAVPRGAQNEEMSWSFLKFSGKKENAVSFHNSTLLPTARLDLIAEQGDEPNLGIFARQAKFSKNNFVPISRDTFSQEFSKLIFALNENQVSIETGLKNLENAMTQELTRSANREKQFETLRKSAP